MMANAIGTGMSRTASHTPRRGSLRRPLWLTELREAIWGSGSRGGEPGDGDKGQTRTSASASDDHRFGTDAPHAPRADALANTTRRRRVLDCDGCCVTSRNRW